MGHRDMERSGISEVVRGKLYFAVLHRPEDLKASWLPGPAICFSVDNELIYEPFYADFGPLNFACTYHFCMKLSSFLELGAYLVLCEGWDAEIAYNPLAEFEPFLPFRDPTCGISTYHLSVLDCIRAIARGKKIGWIDLRTFNIEEYEYFEKVENGDLTWIVPNKIVAFSGPSARRTEVCGYKTLVPEDYVDYFKQSKISTVIRLNKRLYDKRRFTDHDLLIHHDLYFPDGSCPPERIVQRFLEIVEDSHGAVAVHCKAGLGRTGVLIGCFLMKNFRFTANEAIGYLRILRPGSVIGPQQHFLRDMQSRMWRMGDSLRRQRSDNNRNSRVSIGTTSQGNQLARTEHSSSISSPLAALSLTGSQSWGQMKLNGNDPSNEYRRSYSQDGMQSRSNVSQRSNRPSFSRGSGNVSLSMDTRLEQNRRPSSGNEVAGRCPYNLRPRPSSMQPSSPEMQAVFTQRTLNAAGQPRKVVVPVGQMGAKDASPLRRRNSSPQRYSANQE